MFYLVFPMNFASGWQHLQVGPCLYYFCYFYLSIFIAVAEETNSKGMTIDGLEQQNFLSRYNVLNLDKVF